jgi:hypothetical protein
MNWHIIKLIIRIWKKLSWKKVEPFLNNLLTYLIISLLIGGFWWIIELIFEQIIIGNIKVLEQTPIIAETKPCTITDVYINGEKINLIEKKETNKNYFEEMDETDEKIILILIISGIFIVGSYIVSLYE